MNDLDDLIFPYPAKVRRVNVQERKDALLALVKERGALDPVIFDERVPFFWSAEISNDRVDFYYTHMLDSTLNNFENDARTGVSFLPGHKYWELPFGYSLDARKDQTVDPVRTRVIADFYTLPGLSLNSVSTDSLIDGMRSGILRDVSVGFNRGKHWCDICKQNYLGWDCPHIAGASYEMKDRGTVLCTVSIDGARLSEVSAVYDGATPDATIIKAQRMIEAGELQAEAVQLLEVRYRTKLPAVKRTFAGVKVQEQKTMNYEEIVNQIRQALALTSEADVAGSVAGVAAELASIRQNHEATQARIKELEALQLLAEDGRQYRTDLTTEALAEGVRAYGDKFDKATYEEMLRIAPLAVIKRMKTDWELVGNSRFTGGRQTEDEGEAPGKNQQRRVRVPDAAFKA